MGKQWLEMWSEDEVRDEMGSGGTQRTKKRNIQKAQAESQNQKNPTATNKR